MDPLRDDNRIRERVSVDEEERTDASVHRRRELVVEGEDVNEGPISTDYSAIV